MTDTQTTDTQTAAASPRDDFVAYEYLAVRAPRHLEALYRDSYRAFGWIVDGPVSAFPGADVATLKFKRDHRLRSRAMLTDLQRTSERSLEEIGRLEKSKTTTAMAVSLGVGILGSAFLAGSVFAFTGGALVLSIVLGAVGLAGWGLGYLAYGRVKAGRAAAVAPLIDREYATVYANGEQASRLLT